MSYRFSLVAVSAGAHVRVHLLLALLISLIPSPYFHSDFHSQAEVRMEIETGYETNYSCDSLNSANIDDYSTVMVKVCHLMKG